MDNLLTLLKSVAPALATAVGGPLGGAAVAMIADKLGLDDKTVEGVTKALESNPDLTIKLRELELEYAKLDAQDRDSARNREIEIAKSDVHFITKNITSLLALSTLAGALVMTSLIFFVDFPDSQENIIIFVLGSLFGIATQVISYYFGSSQGSKEKTEEIKGMMKR
jgi:uncharacterized protein YebE (UPF0316 family)